MSLTPFFSNLLEPLDTARDFGLEGLGILDAGSAIRCTESPLKRRGTIQSGEVGIANATVTSGPKDRRSGARLSVLIRPTPEWAPDSLGVRPLSELPWGIIDFDFLPGPARIDR